MIQTHKTIVEYGEAMSWQPCAGITSFQLWVRLDTSANTRWAAGGGYDIAAGTAIAADAQVTPPPELAITVEGVLLPWEAVDRISSLNGQHLFEIEPGFGTRETTVPVAEPMAVISYDGDRAIRRDLFRFPVEATTPIENIIEQDRQFLHDLLRARTNATFHGQHREIDLGASGKEVFTTPGALDQRIMEIRARLVWFEQAVARNVVPRIEFW